MARSISMVTSGLGRGGSELQFVQLATGLRDLGWRVHPISLQTGGPYAPVLESRGLAPRCIPTGRFATPAAVASLARCIRTDRPTLVHTQAFRANLWGRIAAIIGRTPVVASVRATYRYLPSAYYPLERALAARSAHLIAPSKATADHLVRRIHVSHRKVEVIPNGVDTVAFAPSAARDAIRERLGLAQRFVVTCPARLHSRKNHHALIAAFSRFAAVTPNAVLILAGDGPLRQQLTDVARATGAEVLLPGDLDRGRLAELLAASDVVASMSTLEGMPNALLEALASGVPVVATAVDGVPEIVTDGVEGILIQPGDTLSMSVALGRLAHSPLERGAMALAARRRAERDHSIAVNVRRHHDLYATLC